MKPLGITIADGPGSPEFKRQAKEWAKFCGGDVVELAVGSLKPAARYRQVSDSMTAHKGAHHLAVFCHGWANGLQLVPMASVKDFAKEIAWATDAPIVTLYACSTADGPHLGGDGGFADALRDALCKVGATGCVVDAHTTAGHTTRNPYVRRFYGAASPVGGVWIVEPKSALWRPWVKALQGPFRWEFPLLTVAEIHARLAAPP